MNRHRPQPSAKTPESKPNGSLAEADTPSAPSLFWRAISGIPFLVVIGIAPLSIYFRIPWVAMLGCGISFVILMCSHRNSISIPMIAWTIILFLFAMRMFLLL